MIDHEVLLSWLAMVVALGTLITILWTMVDALSSVRKAARETFEFWDRAEEDAYRLRKMVDQMEGDIERRKSS